MSIRRYAAVPCLLLAASGAGAVSVNPQGQGQALIYPYYTTQAGNVSLVTLTNHTDKAKIVDLRFAEGENGRSVAALRIYLSPYDSWSGSVSVGDAQAPVLRTVDASCIHAAGYDTLPLPLQQGQRALQFSRADLGDDPGSRGEERLREGFIIAAELASVQPQTAAYVAITQLQCDWLLAAWSPADGYWQTQALRDLANPVGGLSGEVAIVNTVAGTAFGLAATALEDFRGSLRSVVHHIRPLLHGPPPLSQALSDPARGVAVADVIADGRRLQLSYPVADAVHAVSAVLTAAQLSSAFDTSPEIGARTSFVLTYPTRYHYTDPRSPTSSPLPFDRLFQGLRPLQQADGIAFRRLDREGQVLEGGLPQENCAHCPSYPLLRAPGTAVEVVSASGYRDALLGTRLHGDFGFTFAGGSTVPLHGTGWVLLEPGDLTLYPYALPPSLEGRRLVGRPMLGTRITHYAGTNAQDAAVAFSVVAPMSAQAQCVDQQGATCVR
jgi:hypothetical protein